MSKNTFMVMHKSGLYFRVRGYGLTMDFNSTPLFSERNGYNKKLVRFGKFAIGVLRP